MTDVQDTYTGSPGNTTILQLLMETRNMRDTMETRDTRDAHEESKTYDTPQPLTNDVEVDKKSTKSSASTTTTTTTTIYSPHSTPASIVTTMKGETGKRSHKRSRRRSHKRRKSGYHPQMSGYHPQMSGTANTSKFTSVFTANYSPAFIPREKEFIS
jgi:hypothetical protein